MPAGFTRWPWWRRWFGRKAERAAASFFRQLRYQIIATNVDDRLGELDLVLVQNKTIVFVEVRSTENRSWEDVLNSVNPEKQRRISQAALRYLQRHHLLNEVTVRFDVLAIRWPDGQTQPEFHHITHAFEATGRGQLFS